MVQLPDSNRPLAEPAYAKKGEEPTERRTGVYTRVHEDSSTEATKPFEAEVRLCKRSNVMIITGGSRGIGEATIKRFIKSGWRVINISRRSSDLPGVTNIIVDLQHLTTLQNRIKRELEAELPELAVISLIHNAGSFINDTVDNQSLEAVRAVFDVNVFAPILLNQWMIPLMAGGSSIIYVGSTLAEKGIPGCASYIASKHAIAGLMKATCQDLAGKNIHTCCICPGVTETEMLIERCKKAPGLLEILSGLSTYNRLLQPDELAELIEFCAGHPLINGAVIHGNLGQIER